MKRLMNWFSKCTRSSRPKNLRPRMTKEKSFETLESREVFSAEPLPVLMVLADRQDFFISEVIEMRSSLEADGMGGRAEPMAQRTDTEQPKEKPIDQSMAEAERKEYSAIAFVGGWGASAYQYAYNDPDTSASSQGGVWRTTNFDTGKFEPVFGDGGGGDDLLIGGVTTLADHDAALTSLMETWAKL